MFSKQIEISGRPSSGDQCGKTSPAKRKYSRKAATVVGLGALFLLSFATIYRVRELVAALLLFTLAFGIVMIGVFILWLAEEAAHGAAQWLEGLAAHRPPRIVTAARVRARHNTAGRTWN
jgi:cell division protein FtsW (lipid II flippase)